MANSSPFDRHRGARPRQGLPPRQRARPRRRLARGRDRHRARAARPQRRRQDHGGAHPLDHPRARRGHAAILGHDVVKEPDVVRRIIGLAGQYATVDENLTGRENIRMVGRLSHLSRTQRQPAGRRAARGVRADRRRRPRPQDLLGRHAPPPRPGRRPGGQPAGALPRRADDRPRPPEPPGPVGRSSRSWWPRAPPCCSPPSTSRRPTAWPATSSWSTTAGSSPRARRPSSRPTSGTSVVSVTLGDARGGDRGARRC